MYDWYTQKSYGEYTQMRDWQVVALIIGGAGSLLAFLGQEAWIAVTTSGAVTVAALANLKLSGRTYLLYYRTADDLDDRVGQWQNDGKPSDPEADAKLVEDFENIFRQEGKLWRQQAIDALSQVDSSINETFRSGTGNMYKLREWDENSKKQQNGE